MTQETHHRNTKCSRVGKKAKTKSRDCTVLQMFENQNVAEVKTAKRVVRNKVGEIVWAKSFKTIFKILLQI